jgi:hypothetical protein
MPPLWPVLGRFLGREGISELNRYCCCSVGIEEMLLPRHFCQPLAPRSEAEAFQRDVLLPEAVIGTLQFPFGRARFVKLTLQVAELSLHLVESLQKATEEFLAGRQIIRDLIGGAPS